ncbi:hypothetical protein KAJ89_00465 [Candidatus Parcubacteria bacterium]|nr:hypothetical protein [Candidatus Parcubacteria bacterium]
MEIKKIKIIILGFVILVVGAAIILFWPKDNVKEPVPVAVRDAADRTYVRLSLFNTMPNKISLEIPEDWEGSYRVKDGGNLARIFFIQGAGEWELLLFKQFSQSQWVSNMDKNWQKILENNELIVAYILSTGEGISLAQMSEFNNMRADVSALLKSIKMR